MEGAALGAQYYFPRFLANQDTFFLTSRFLANFFFGILYQNTRRRGTSSEHMRDDMCVHIHREWFNMRVNAAL